ncbi:MAG: outer membrane beta-barrel protein [Bacteroidia bacterium]|mgnify:FL=1
MKRILKHTVAFAFICISSLAFAQTDSTANNEKETVFETNKVKVVIKEKVIVTNDGKDTIVERTKEIVDGSLDYLKNEIEKEIEEEVVEDFEVVEGPEFIETRWNKFHLGLNNLMNTDGKLETDANYGKMEVSPANSVNFQWDVVTQAMNLYKGKVRLVYGIGIDYNNYRFKNDISLMPDSIPLMVLEDGINYDKNKLVTQHLNIPVMINFKLAPKNAKEVVYVSAGANLGYLIRSHQKQVWDVKGKKKNKIRDDYNLEQFRIGYEVQFGYKNIVLFGKYFPKSIFKANQGPELRTVSAGILIGKV